jgi:hypothetical protein
MENITISVSTLKKLVAIANEYLEGEYTTEANKQYFIGRREAYQNILDNYTTTN